SSTRFSPGTTSPVFWARAPEAREAAKRARGTVHAGFMVLLGSSGGSGGTGPDAGGADDGRAAAGVDRGADRLLRVHHPPALAVHRHAGDPPCGVDQQPL